MSLPLIVLRPDDAARTASLHAASADNPWPVQDYRSMLKQSAYLGLGAVNEADDSLAAFLICQFAVDTADLLMIATHPSSRRKGYARSLLSALISRLGERGIARLRLDVAADNTSAIALYHTMEFAEDGLRPNYYKNDAGRIDAVLMSRPITGLPTPEKA